VKPPDKIEEIKRKFPNWDRVGTIISEAEMIMRNSLKLFLRKEYGESWEDVMVNKEAQITKKLRSIRQKKRTEDPTKPEDILEYATLGEIKKLSEETFPEFLKTSFLEPQLVKDSVSVLLRMKTHHHGRPGVEIGKEEDTGVDISQEDVTRADNAYKNISALRKQA